MAGTHAPLADQVMSAVRGTQDAQRLLHTIRQGCAPADALREGFEQVMATCDVPRARAFARELQKAIERGGSPA